MTIALTDRVWLDVCALTDIPLRGARRIEGPGRPIAIFRTGEDAVYALVDQCPHKQGPLSMGIVHGDSVTCPLHSMRISLATGELLGADAGKGCTPRVDVRIEDGRVQIAAHSLRQ